MNQTEHKSITALMKAIKKDMEAGITQIAVIVEESSDKSDKAEKKYIYSRPFVNTDEVTVKGEE